MDTSKQAYLSPATGVLEITVIRDSRPYVAITLDLGIPNFTVFSLKLPLVQDKPSSMSTLVAEAVHALLDEMSAFMLSTGYDEEVIVQVYAAVLACYKGMSSETDSNKSVSPASKDPTIKSFEGSFKLPMTFINETYAHVVTAKQAGKVINVGPKTRHLELTYEKPSRVSPDDTAKVIRQFRNRSLKSQPQPLYIVVYDQMGKPKATIPLGTDFKNKLLKTVYKKGSASPEFSPTVKFNNEIEMKMTNVVGIPQTIFVGTKQFTPQAYVGDDMALYRGQGGFLVKFSDGRCVPFTDRPSIQKLRATNFPVPSSYPNRWILIQQEEESPVNKAVDAEGNEVNEADAEAQKDNTDPLPTSTPDAVEVKASLKLALNTPRLVKDFGKVIEQHYKKDHPRIANPPNEYGAEAIINRISALDPTPNKEYTAWIVGQYARGRNPKHPDKGIKRFEDIASRVIPALKRYHALKVTKTLPQEQRDINKIPGLSALEDLISKYEDQEAVSKRQLSVEREKKFFEDGEAELFFDDGQIKVVIPKTEEAAKYFGINTRWCTAASQNNMFDNYNSDGPLYIILIRANNERYQFHFESAQFMDERDEPIDPYEFLSKHPQLIPVFKYEAEEAIDRGKGKCEACDGSGRESCGYCHGYGQTECFSCNGNGYKDCDECGGTGEVGGEPCETCENGTIPCMICDGDGEIGCDACGGDGLEDCGQCEGTGTAKPLREFVYACSRIPLDAKAEAAKTSAEEKGDCFADCYKAMSSGQAPGMQQPLSKMDNVKLVHGLVNIKDKQGDHSWIEFDTGKWHFVWDPQKKRVFDRDEYYKALNPKIEAAYPEEEALALGVRSGHSGPWHKEAAKKQPEWIHMDEKPAGMFSIEQWRYKDTPWRLIRKHAESGEERFIVVNPLSGNALPNTYDSFEAAVTAADEIFKQWGVKEARKTPQELYDGFKATFLNAYRKEAKDAMKCSNCGRVFSQKENHLKTCPECGAEVFWSGTGQGASGVLPVCVSTGRVCLAWRSAEVHQGNCWGTLGGAIKDNADPAESAMKEMKEEVGYSGGITLHPAYVFTSGDFKYYNFIGEVSDEFSFQPQEKHAWETEGIQWFSYEEVIEMMKLDKSQFHPGLIALFEHSGDLIRQIAENKGNKPVEASQ